MYLWQALACLGEAAYLNPHLPYGTPGRPLGVDLDDDASVRDAFRSIAEREWGPAALGDDSR